MVKWDKAYRKKGLNIVAVYDGRSTRLKWIQFHRKHEKIDYPILFDCGGRMKKELKVPGYPYAYLVGKHGKVAWEGSVRADTTRKKVQKLFEKMLKP